MKKITFIKSILLAVLLLIGSGVWGQNISVGTPYSQNFDGIGSTATATLPTGWKIENIATVRSVTTAYASVANSATANALTYNSAMSSTAANGRWNFGGTSATDRAVGGISSASASLSVNMYLQLTNNGVTNINDFTISYDAERFRNGTNTAGFSIRFYYSTTGAASSWVEATDLIATFAGSNADNNGSTTNPMQTINISNKTLSQSLNTGSTIYFAWSYSVTSGTTTSNAQALGIDNIVIIANGSASSPTITAPSPTSLSGFTTTTGTASTPQTFTVGGSNLTADLVVTAPASYEVRESGIGSFGSSVSFTPASGTVASKTIEVRIAASAGVGSPSGNVVCSSTDATSRNVAVSGTVSVTTPTTQASEIYFTEVGESGMTINWTNGNGSSRAVFVKSGSGSITNPVDGTTYSASSNWSSKGTQLGTSGYYCVYNGSSTSITLTNLAAGTTYYAQVFEYNGSGATSKYYNATSTGNPNSQATATPSPLITLTPITLTGFTYLHGSGPSTQQTFTVNGSNLSGDIIISAPTNYEISKTSGSGYTTPLTFTQSGGSVSTTTVYVRLKAGLSAGNYNNELITANSTGASDKTVTCSGNVTLPTGSFVKITSLDNLTDGEYVIVNSGDGFAMNNTHNGTFLAHTAITPTSNTLTNPSSSIVWKIETNGSGRTIFNEVSAKYVSYTGSSNDLQIVDAVTTNNQRWNFAYSSNVFTVRNTAIDSRYLQYNSSSPRFACYTNSQQNLLLYKKVVINPEPSAHVTAFNATENGQSSILIGWSDAVGADGYLIKASMTSFEAIAPPVDGTPEIDGTFVKNVAKDVEIAEFLGLSPSTTYYFKIWPYSNSGVNINYKTDGSVPEISTETGAVAAPNVIITEVYGAGGNAGATFKNDFIELYNTTESTVDISGWSVQYYSSTGTGTSTGVTVMPTGSIIPAKSHFLVLQSGGSNGSELFEPNVAGTVSMGASSGKVILYTTNSAQTISDIASITGNVNFKDYMPYGASTPEWGTPTDIASTTTSATRKKASGEYVYTQNIGNDFEIVSPTPQNTGKFQSKASSNWANQSTWEFTDNGTWVDATIIPANTTSKVEIASGTEVTIAANATASSTTILNGGQLTLNNGFTFAPGTFTIKDGGTFKDARSNENKSAINANVEVLLTGSPGSSITAVARQWWYVSSPVSNALSGVFNPAGDNNLGYFDETLSTPNYVQIEGNSDALEVGKGYLFQNKATATYTFTGALNTGDVTLNLTRTGTTQGQRGFHIVGNPYPSYLNWKAGFDAGTTSNIRNTIWYKTTSGSANGMKVLTYNADTNVGTIVGVSGVVPPMQGFWMKVHADNSNGVIKFTNDMRSHVAGTANPRKAPAVSNTQLLRLKVSNGVVTDELVLVGIAGALDSFEKYDSEKMANNSIEIPELFALVGTQEIAINSVEALTAGKQFVLGFRPGKTGNFSIEASELSNVDAKVVLVDNLASTQTELQAGSTYSFTSDATATNNRFSIEFRAPGAATSVNEVNASNTLVFVNEANQIAVQIAGVKDASISVFNLAGQQLATQQAEGQITVLAQPFSAGVYLVKVNNHLQKVIVK